MITSIQYALHKAGDLIISRYGKHASYDFKESRSSIVTETDLESEKIIIDLIEKSNPGHNILSEESGFLDRNSEYTWVIDPLDGTSNFVAGIPWFGILIAVLKNGIPHSAGAFLPVQDRYYLAGKGKGATLNGRPLKVSNEDPADCLLAFSADPTDDPVHLKRITEFYTRAIRISRNVRSTNSLNEMLMVAEGRFGGCINMSTKIWDIASPWLIIREAGGLFVNVDGSEIDFSAGILNPDKSYTVMGGGEKIVQMMRGMRE